MFARHVWVNDGSDQTNGRMTTRRKRRRRKMEIVVKNQTNFYMRRFAGGQFTRTYLWTKWTIVHFGCWILRMVPIDMLPQCLFQYKWLWAMWAFVWPFTAVCHQVTLQNLLLNKWPIANLAFKWFFARMYAYVTGQCAVTGKPFLTVWTLLARGLCIMIAFMID